MKLTDDEELNARIVIRQALAKKGCLPLDVEQMDAIVRIVLPAMMVPVSPLAEALDAYIATGKPHRDATLLPGPGRDGKYPNHVLAGTSAGHVPPNATGECPNNDPTTGNR